LKDCAGEPNLPARAHRFVRALYNYLNHRLFLLAALLQDHFQTEEKAIFDWSWPIAEGTVWSSESQIAAAALT